MVHLQRAVEMSHFGNWKKLWYFTDNQQTNNYYYISQMLRYQKKRKDCVFFSISGFVSNFFCFREIFAGFDINESYNYIQLVI